MADLKLSSKNPFPLDHRTTYSGADATVFIYRDLVSLKDKIENNKGNSKDETVSRSENDSTDYGTGNSLNPNASSSGGTALGIRNPNNDTYQSTGITSLEDNAFRTNGAVTGGGSNKKNNNSENLGLQGMDSIVAELGSLHSINYSSFREKNAVRTLGRTHARSYTRGQRTVAGTMVFTVLQSHEILNFANKASENRHSMLDQIDPFNILIVFANEYGSMSAMHLFNVDINTESQSMSIDSLLLNNTMNFYAQDMLPMEEIGNVFTSTSEMLSAAFGKQAVKDLQSKLKSRMNTGINTINSAISGESKNDKAIQQLLQRSRGLF